MTHQLPHISIPILVQLQAFLLGPVPQYPAHGFGNGHFAARERTCGAAFAAAGAAATAGAAGHGFGYEGEEGVGEGQARAGKGRNFEGLGWGGLGSVEGRRSWVWKVGRVLWMNWIGKVGGFLGSWGVEIGVAVLGESLDAISYFWLFRLHLLSSSLTSLLRP